MNVPYTSVLEGIFRNARRKLDAGESQPPTLFVVGRQESSGTVIPLLGEDHLRQRWFHREGQRQALLRPRAACVLQDVPRSAADFWGEYRSLVVSYQDADGLRRAQELCYLGNDGEEGYTFEDKPKALAEGDPRWEAVALSMFFKGVTQGLSEHQAQQRTRRTPAWRFRK